MSDEELLKKLKACVGEQGLLISGNGMIIKKLDKLIELQDRTNLLLSFIEKKIEKKDI